MRRRWQVEGFIKVAQASSMIEKIVAEMERYRFVFDQGCWYYG
jgi:hypothetical protein